MANSYTVTLEVREERCLTLELVDVQADTEEQACEVACQTYNATGRKQFTLQCTDLDDTEVTDFHAEEDE
jgi:hypothetical protein